MPGQEKKTTCAFNSASLHSEKTLLTRRAVGRMWPPWSCLFLAVQLKIEFDKKRGGDPTAGLTCGVGGKRGAG